MKKDACEAQRQFLGDGGDCCLDVGLGQGQGSRKLVPLVPPVPDKPHCQMNFEKLCILK